MKRKIKIKRSKSIDRQEQSHSPVIDKRESGSRHFISKKHVHSSHRLFPPTDRKGNGIKQNKQKKALNNCGGQDWRVGPPLPKSIYCQDEAVPIPREEL